MLIRSAQSPPRPALTGLKVGLQPWQSTMLVALGATAPVLDPAAMEPVGLRLKTTAVAPVPSRANHRDKGLRMRIPPSPVSSRRRPRGTAEVHTSTLLVN